MSEVVQKNRYTRCKVSGLWAQVGANGQTFWTGRTEEGVKFTLFPNGFKTEANHPDYILYTDMIDNEGTIEKGTRAAVAVTDLKAPVKRA